MIQIVEKLKKTLWNMLGRCFSKVPSIRPDFPNWYRELRREREREREAELSQTQRGCQKPQLFSVAASLVLGSSLREEPRQQGYY